MKLPEPGFFQFRFYQRFGLQNSDQNLPSSLVYCILRLFLQVVFPNLSKFLPQTSFKVSKPYDLNPNKICLSYFLIVKYNTRHLQVKGEVYLGSQFVELSFHSWLAPRHSGMGMTQEDCPCHGRRKQRVEQTETYFLQSWRTEVFGRHASMIES